MRNLVPILFVALAFGAITCKKQTDVGSNAEGLAAVDSTYIVFLKPTYLKPLVLEQTFYTESFAKQAEMRKKLIEEVMTFCKDRHITGVDSSRIFVDVTVAFWTNLTL